MALREAAEAGDWVRSRVLSPGAVSWYLRALERQLGPDLGLGDSRLRQELTTLLRSGLAPDSRERRRLVQLMPLVTNGYLERWASAADSAKTPSPERLARAVATHLLDCGHSSGYLHRWVRALGANRDITLADLLRDACRLAEQEDRDFEVLVPFISVPDRQSLAEHLPEWRPPGRVAEWFAEHKFDHPPRHNGAFLYVFTAKDVVAAAREAGNTVRRLEARRSYSRSFRRRLEPVGKAWVAGHSTPLPLLPPERGVNILSLETERTMYAVNRSDRLDEALELAAQLNAGVAASAVAGAWAAIESLLFQPGDKADVEEGRAVSADRLAGIVACSWPRAELTALSHKHKPQPSDPTSKRLAQCRHNLDRSEVIAEELAAGTPLAPSSYSDIAAAERLKAVLLAPYAQLSDVRQVYQGVFRRLYRQRNIVMHGGSTAAIALGTAHGRAAARCRTRPRGARAVEQGGRPARPGRAGGELARAGRRPARTSGHEVAGVVA
ncbi:integrase [Allokutzneria sp. NRRL B-24872]|uniref:integrase n=1 Tax=Allokutzneria sp. NRRL B-24872 TaxID=1137961 RepID=UPI001178C42B|nr:integrase [Allokutzneria sp. NRRL B-24872]